MPKNFYELEEVARALGISVEEVEEMISLRELPVVSISTRRLVQARGLEAVLERVRSGGSARTRRKFRAKTVEMAVREASASQGIAPKSLAYEVPRSRVPGLSPRDARIMVDLLANAENADRRDPEPSALAEEQRPERPGASVPPPAVDGRTHAGTAGGYYAPGQVARLLDRDLHEINLWIYTRKLPVVSINDYRWVPREAVDELLSELEAERSHRAQESESERNDPVVRH